MREDADRTRVSASSSKDRDNRYDALRAIGLMAIILAHSRPPEALFQLRNFDVPLMVIVSGSVFTISLASSQGYLAYVSRRVKNLLVPTWILLCIYFTYFQLLDIIVGKPFPFSTSGVIDSYMLLRSPSGAGYVWIIRVFILVAAITPLFYRLYLKRKDIYLYVVSAVYIVYELIWYFYNKFSSLVESSYIRFMFDNVILYALPYGCLSALGIYLAKAPNRHLLCMMLAAICMFLFLAAYYDQTQLTKTQQFKYPPRIYYLSYGFSASTLLYLLSRTKVFSAYMCCRPILFIGRSALWIYLWHIFFLAICDFLGFPEKIVPGFIELYIVLVAASTSITYCQQKIARHVIATSSMSGSLKHQIRVAFLP